MSKRLHHHAPCMHVLAKGTPKQHQGVIQGANKELMRCLCEYALNVPNGNIGKTIPLTPADKKKLKKYQTENSSPVSRSDTNLPTQKKIYIWRKQRLKLVSFWNTGFFIKNWYFWIVVTLWSL